MTAAGGSGSSSVSYGLKTPVPSGAGAQPAAAGEAAAAAATATAAGTLSDAAGSVSSSLGGVDPSFAGAPGLEGGAGDLGEAKAEVVEPWVAVGGSWRDEDNVCGYWRFSEGAEVGHLEGEQKVTELHARGCKSVQAYSRG